MDVGAKRFSFIGEQWENEGHEVEILARRIRSDEAKDATLPRPGRVHWIGSVFPRQLSRKGLIAQLYNRLISGFIGVPDPEVGWLPSSVLVGRRVCKAFKPDVIVATGPSFTSFLSGTTISRSMGVPLILDYRDPWTAFEWSDTRYGRRMKSPLRRRMEQWTVGSASALVFATESMLTRFKANSNAKMPELLRVISNGFNDQLSIPRMDLPADAFNILYTGNMYGERKLSTLAQAIEALRCRKGWEDANFAIHIFGKIKGDDRERLTAMGLMRLVHEYSPVGHTEVLRYMKAADALFLPSGSDVSYALPFKVFDYLSVRRPILAVSPDGSAVAKLMAEIDCGEVSKVDEPLAIADALQNLVMRTSEYSYAGRENFMWQKVANQYAELIRNVIARKSCSSSD